MSSQKPKQGYKLVKVLFRKYEEIPKEWELTVLEKMTPNNDKTSIRMGPFGSSLKTHELLSSGKIKTLWIENIVNNEFTWKYQKFISEEKYEELKGFTVKPDDILITMMGTLGKVAIVPQDIGTAIISSHLLKITLDHNKLLPFYLYYFLKTHFVFRQIIRESRGVVMGGLNTGIIKNILVIIPSILEQEKIVSVLSNVDNLINSYDTTIEETKHLKQGLMQKLLTKGIDHKKFKNIFLHEKSSISLGSIPERWEVVSFDELRKQGKIIEFQDGNHGELHPKKEDFSDSGRHYITASQISKGEQVLFEKCKFLPEENCKKLRIGFTKAKDVLFTHNATVGRVAVMPEDIPDSIVGTSVTYYRLNEDHVNRFFFAKVLSSNFIKKQYSTDMDQSTRQQFSILKQAKLKFPLPPLDEQKKIASILIQTDAKISSLKIKKIQLEQIKKELMKNLLSGKIRVKF